MSHVHSQTYGLAACQVSARSLQKQRRNLLLFSVRKYRFSKTGITPIKWKKSLYRRSLALDSVIALGGAKLPVFKVLYLSSWRTDFD